MIYEKSQILNNIQKSKLKIKFIKLTSYSWDKNNNEDFNEINELSI